MDNYTINAQNVINFIYNEVAPELEKSQGVTLYKLAVYPITTWRGFHVVMTFGNDSIGEFDASFRAETVEEVKNRDYDSLIEEAIYNA